ncbi:hypothetical protein AB0J90_34275 [Micromonospora sp. NPDC049523]|uniref:hypothetical protein n=1 Tax=Micromonospora sp. NPDC049523 TaxID=3155921 RepID=UPI00341FD145
MTEQPPEALFRRWVHVREEDDADVRVYRPADRPLPPARGRDGIEFRPDGTFIDYLPGPADAPTRAPGQWRTDADDRLRLTGPAGRGSTVFHLVAVDDDTLRLRPLGGEQPPPT